MALPFSRNTTYVGGVSEVKASDLNDLQDKQILAEGALAAFFGAGTDGDLVLDGTNTHSLLSKSGSTYTALSDLVFDDLTVNSGVILNMAGFKLLVHGTLANAGTIQNMGSAAVTTTAGAGAPGGSLPAGGNGAAGRTTAGSGSNGTSMTASIGGAGGAGGDDVGNSGGAGGTVAGPTAANGRWRSFIAMLTGQVFGDGPVTRLKGGAGGGSGGLSGGTTSTGGGGGGGGMMVIAAFRLNNTGTIRANGGPGGDGTGGGPGGGGGGGGAILLTYRHLDALGTVQASGGIGGFGNAGAQNGAAGSAGNVYTLVLAS